MLSRLYPKSGWSGAAQLGTSLSSFVTILIGAAFGGLDVVGQLALVQIAQQVGAGLLRHVLAMPALLSGNASKPRRLSSWTLVSSGAALLFGVCASLVVREIAVLYASVAIAVYWISTAERYRLQSENHFRLVALMDVAPVVVLGFPWLTLLMFGGGQEKVSLSQLTIYMALTSSPMFVMAMWRMLKSCPGTHMGDGARLDNEPAARTSWLLFDGVVYTLAYQLGLLALASVGGYVALGALRVASLFAFPINALALALYAPMALHAKASPTQRVPANRFLLLAFLGCFAGFASLLVFLLLRFSDLLPSEVSGLLVVLVQLAAFFALLQMPWTLVLARDTVFRGLALTRLSVAIWPLAFALLQPRIVSAESYASVVATSSLVMLLLSVWLALTVGHQEGNPGLLGLLSRVWEGRFAQAASFVRRISDHPGNTEVGYFLLMRCLWQRLLVQAGHTVEVPLGKNSSLYVKHGYKNSLAAIGTNPPDYWEWRFWMKVIAAGDRFVDVGANVGVYTLLMAELGAYVQAFEPSSWNRQLLGANLHLNGVASRVHVRSCALSDTRGKGSLVDATEPTAHVSFEPSQDGAEVEVGTLDEQVSDHIHGLKIDVEGAELLVLKGATTSLLQRRIDYIQVEANGLSEERYGYSRNDLVTFLRQMNFEVISVNELGRICRLEPDSRRDIFAVRHDLLGERIHIGQLLK